LQSRELETRNSQLETRPDARRSLATKSPATDTPSAMDSDIPANKHVKMAVKHLERVLNYAPMVAEGREATVHLTQQDWQVVADMLFKMDADDAIPDEIDDYGLSNENRTITLTTADHDIDLEIVTS
jgi:hypothetical protein